MKYSVIDIGSNSIRLTVYKVKNGNFKILFKDKKMGRSCRIRGERMYKQ